MKTFTVHLMKPYCTWESVEAKDEDEAISKCTLKDGFDCNEVHQWLACSEDEDADG